MAGKQHDSELARESLRKARMRATDARVAVLSVLIRGRAPLTHAEVTETAKKVEQKFCSFLTEFVGKI